MAVNEDSRYAPRAEGTFAGRAEKLYRQLAYDLWRRELKRFFAGHGTMRRRIVDIGCGPGFLLSFIGKWFEGAELTGVDQSEALLNIAQSRCKGMTALKGDASAIPLPDGYADAAFALHVVEHLAQPAQFFQEARRVLRPGGLLVIATPNADGWGARLMGRKWKGYSDPTHVSLHGPSYWSDLLNSSGFDIVQHGTTGLSGIPLLDRMPLGLIQWIPVFLFGYFPWLRGEAFVCAAIRRPKTAANAN